MSHSISAIKFSKIIASGQPIEVIDVRSPAEFESIHLCLARNEPLEKIDVEKILRERGHDSSTPLFVVCRSGMRGKQACDKLRAAGVTNIFNVEGGTLACTAIGIPATKGRKHFSISAQVQTLTGLIVIVSSTLAIVGQTYWASVSAVMGLGLLYSGLSDSCPLGSVLAIMPWNQTQCKAPHS